MNRSRLDVDSVRCWRLLPLALGALGLSACDNGDSLCPAVMYEGVIVTIDAAYIGLGGLSGLAVESQIADGEWFPCWGPHSTSELPSTHYLTCFTNRTAPMRVRATYDDGTVREDAFDLVGDNCGPFEPIRVALEELPVVVEGSGEGSGDPDSCWAWITEANPTCAEGCATMHGDDSFEACAFLPSTFSPVQPVFCHPRDLLLDSVACLQHDGQTYYVHSEPIGMENLPGWTSCGCDTPADDPSAARPSPPYSDPWPLGLASGVEHGFPMEMLSLDCDPGMFQNMSPAVLRESAGALVYGTLRAVEIPDGDVAGSEPCVGDRWDGLRLVVEVEGGVGPFAPAVGAQVELYVPSDQLLAWSRRPWWDSADGVARWSDWLEESPQPVPLVGGRVMAWAHAAQPAGRTDAVLLRAVWLFSISPTGDVIAQADSRGSCHSRLEVDGEVPQNYGNIDTLWTRISTDELTEPEQERVAEFDRATPVESALQWVDCVR